MVLRCSPVKVRGKSIVPADALTELATEPDTCEAALAAEGHIPVCVAVPTMPAVLFRKSRLPKEFFFVILMETPSIEIERRASLH